MIGMDGERELGKSVQSSLFDHHDDDTEVSFIILISNYFQYKKVSS